MAIKQALAVQVMETATNGKVAVASLSEVTNGWVALVINGAEKKVVCVTQGECPLSAMWAVESSCVQGGLQVDIMALNANKRQLSAALLNGQHPVPRDEGHQHRL